MSSIFVSNSTGKLKSLSRHNEKFLSFFEGVCFLLEAEEKKLIVYRESGDVFLVNDRGLVDLELFLIEWQPENVVFYLDSHNDYKIFLKCIVSLLPFVNVWFLIKCSDLGVNNVNGSMGFSPLDVWRSLGLLGSSESLKDFFWKRINPNVGSIIEPFYLFSFLNENVSGCLVNHDVSRAYEDDLFLEIESKLHYERFFKKTSDGFDLSRIYEVHKALSSSREKMILSEEDLEVIESSVSKTRFSTEVLSNV